MKAFARAVAAGTALSLFAGTLVAQERGAPVVVKLDIEAQPIVEALSAWAQQTGFQLILPESIVPPGIVSKPLIGRLEPEAALRMLLADTALAYEFLDSRTVAVSLKANTSGVGAPSLIRLAQTTDASAAASGSGADERIEEVVVTARKRAENLSDVPISIAVVGSADIENRRLVNAEDYLRGIPGVSQIEGYTGQTVTIRGIESSPFYQNFFTGTTVATYFGETPTTNSGGIGGGTNVDLKLVDVERVEVLRGPQGTSFGSSSLGGTVRVIPVAPRLNEFEAKLGASYSVTQGYGDDNYMVQGTLNAPVIADKLAVRASAYQFDDSGFVRNRSTTNVPFQNQVVTPFGAQAHTRDGDDIGAYFVRGARIAALFAPVDELELTLTYVTQENERDGTPVSSSGDYEQTGLTLSPEHVRRGAAFGRADFDIDIINAAAEYDLGWASVFATYSDTRSGAGVGYTRTIQLGDNLPQSQDSESDHRERNTELRFTTQLDGPVNAIAGVYHERQKDTAFFDNLWIGSLETNPFGPVRAIGLRNDRRTLEQKAAFGEITWEITEQLAITGGVRHYDFERHFRVDTVGPIYAGSRADVRSDASGQSYRGTVSYKPTRRSMIYAGYSEGFRLGQSQIGLPAANCDQDADGVVDGTSIPIESTRQINSDTVENYEAGGNFQSPSGRLSISGDVFHMKWLGVPVNVLPGSGTCTLSYLANAGEAHSTGIELQVSMQLADGFQVDFGGSLIEAELDTAVPVLNAAKGNRLPGSPGYNANVGLEYQTELRGHETSFRLDTTYVGDYYGNLAESPATRSGDYTKMDASVRFAFGATQLMLFVNNVTNEDEFTFRNSATGQALQPRTLPYFGYRLRPRTVGVQLGYTF